MIEEKSIGSLNSFSVKSSRLAFPDITVGNTSVRLLVEPIIHALHAI